MLDVRHDLALCRAIGAQLVGDHPFWCEPLLLEEPCQQSLGSLGRMRPVLGFKSPETASIILSGIELVHMMRKRQARFAFNSDPSLAEQFTVLAAA